MTAEPQALSELNSLGFSGIKSGRGGIAFRSARAGSRGATKAELAQSGVRLAHSRSIDALVDKILTIDLPDSGGDDGAGAGVLFVEYGRDGGRQQAVSLLWASTA